MTLIKEIKVNSVMSKTKIPLGGYAVNPYVGCTHGCKYCYASFMKRFTGHKESWGSFLDVKTWPVLRDPHKYDDERVVLGTVTDPYLPEEAIYMRTRRVLEQLVNSRCKLTICTKSDLVLRDMDVLGKMHDVTVSFSVNTLDEDFQGAMDKASRISRRIEALRKLYEAGIRTVCFVSPVFPGLTDLEAIITRVRDFVDYVWVENLNLRGSFKSTVMDYVRDVHPELMDLYVSIYDKKDVSYWLDLEKGLRELASRLDLSVYDNYLPDGRSRKGHPGIVDYLFHEQVRGSENKGTRNR